MPVLQSLGWQTLSVWVKEAVEHQRDHGEDDNGFGHLTQRLLVFGQASLHPSQPSVFSTIHLWGITTKPVISAMRRTMSSEQRPNADT